MFQQTLNSSNNNNNKLELELTTTTNLNKQNDFQHTVLALYINSRVESTFFNLCFSFLFYFFLSALFLRLLFDTKYVKKIIITPHSVKSLK